MIAGNYDGHEDVGVVRWELKTSYKVSGHHPLLLVLLNDDVLRRWLPSLWSMMEVVVALLL